MCIHSAIGGEERREEEISYAFVAFNEWIYHYNYSDSYVFGLSRWKEIDKAKRKGLWKLCRLQWLLLSLF